jgi:endonuclease/exonuclease/phosphatase (EEP) superfamily protein YafD
MAIIPAVLSIILIISVFLSLIKNDFWIYKILEYPRLQKLAMVILVMASWYFFWPLEKVFHQVLFGALFLAMIYLIYKIGPYTVFFKKEVLKINPAGKGNEIKIFAANVLQTNRKYEKMISQIRLADPDIFFLLETNKDWDLAFKEFGKDYPYNLLAPLENTYGLLLYSKFELLNGSINYLVKNDIPSIEAIVVLPSGQHVKIWGLHPEPPVPGENLYSTAKDKELMKVAIKAKEEKLPCIVFGDLNDVAWSHTTELFRKVSGLLDPRRGRGFYSTFSAHHWFIRYPLDYIFCSSEFGLVEMKRMPKNGSDHFATLTHLSFQPEIKHKQEEPQASKEERSEAVEMAQQSVKE